ncbi:hypothetical protein AALP_AA8G393800 [Arabis alpina]|uniref:S-adenosylmethionine-dependent methyltransferase n=1 Tax=Arabis alpina TaxID=50452 RepID=A0A087GCB7_ARAAL|nr:hypothetical protein AALP_AA8G393800 [Arabis alpina]
MTTPPDWIMIGGEGPESYNQQSSYQRALLEAAKGKMTEAISTNLSLDLISNRFSIADFGCASGPNTFVAVQNIIDGVEEKYRRETGQNPEDNIEFQVLFNDFSLNDFNTLFQTLPPGRRYYSAGVPGSFFDRVLPKQSFHIGVMSYAFHFTSKIPKAEELVPGGLMLLLGSCLRDGVKMSETPKGIVMDFIGESLSDLAQQGVTEQAKVDTFKTSIYFAEQGEMRQIIEENGKFTIEAFEDIIHANGEFPLDPKILAISFKAFYGAFISAHFGVEVMRKAFELVEFKAREEISRLHNAKPGMQYLIVLRKN